jgi:hypothetical protein
MAGRTFEGTAPVAAAILAAVSPGFQPGGLTWKRNHDAGSVLARAARMPPDTAGRMPTATDRWQCQNATCVVEEYLKWKGRRSPRRSLGAAGHTIGEAAPVFCARKCDLLDGRPRLVGVRLQPADVNKLKLELQRGHSSVAALHPPNSLEASFAGGMCSANLHL